MGRHSSAAFFDLDDTLIDTRGVLLPAALRRVADATGLAVERLDRTGKRIDEVLAGIDEVTPEQRGKAAAAWYSPEVPPLEPLPGARETLEALRGRMFLFLVTRGDPPRQGKKIERCGLGPLFDEIAIRAIEGDGSKRDDFVRLMEAHGLGPERCAVIGDDPRDELRIAAELGCLVIDVHATPLRDIVRTLDEAGYLPPT